jgi:hypothetical protein
METRSYSTRLFIVLSIIPCLFACQKKEYDNSYTIFGHAYFKNQTTVTGNDFGVKYEGSPVDYNTGSGGVELPEGEGTFTFYNTKTGAVLAEKKVTVSKANPPHYILFQPLPDLPVAFLDPNAQANEEAAPAGFMKIKIANLSQVAIPDKTIDIVVQSTVVSVTKFGPVDTIKAVGKDLGEAGYVLVRRGVRAGAIQTRYRFSFLDAATKQPLLAAGGAAFTNNTDFATSSFPSAVKGVFTIYLTDVVKTTNTVYLKRDNTYYDIQPNVLFND